ncbi:MAG: hypothetical protein M1823_000373 [Watsoniomyces obsoletus]|nr:MAG: hypothetical protein M1823_000373 [Watsoniomyces obsoletus]
MAASSALSLVALWRLILLLNVPGLLCAQALLPRWNSAITNGTANSNSSYWLANIKRQGITPFNPNGGNYTIYRNVREFGAIGDGVTDDTVAINRAISSGNRCGKGCDSTTTTPAIVYFPPGRYLVHSPIIQYYFTQLIGDALEPPTLLPTANFTGIAVIDANPYDNTGQNWHANQNNFFRQIRNFVIDLRSQPPETGTGIHWQVAQATSLQNIRFEMHRRGANNKQQGIFMENGSGGFMADLTFNGGRFGMWVGNQQFTIRNLTFNDCLTAIYMNWNWVWSLKSLTINNCDVGVDMSQGGMQQTVGSVMLQDSKISNTRIGVLTSFSNSSAPVTGGTLIVDNTEFSGAGDAVSSSSNYTLLAGNSKVGLWGQGRQYQSIPNQPFRSARFQGPLEVLPKPSSLLDGRGAFFERSRPQYEHYPTSDFLSVRDFGAKGDGKTDDTAAIQNAFNHCISRGAHIIYFDHGAYIISRTVYVPAGVKITGEVHPTILAKGEAFSDPSRPTPVFQVGRPGDVGAVEMTDIAFGVVGPQPGAIMVQWNLANSEPGASGMWDVHMRIGGVAGSQIGPDNCAKNPNVTAPAKPECIATSLLLHITSSASGVYMENNWIWVADHDLDAPGYGQINVFNGRGVLIESAGPTWIYGAASEHHQLYNWQFSKASNIYAGVIQSETPYFQSNPNALTPFEPGVFPTDPTFAECTTDQCRKSWGLRIIDSKDIWIYGTGLYSFFENWAQTCVDREDCQENMVEIEQSTTRIFGLSTKASVNMVESEGRVVPQVLNQNNFCSTLALFHAGTTPSNPYALRRMRRF